MDNWRFDITDQGKADLKSLDAEVQQRVLEKLEWFVENFINLVPIPLGGKWRGSRILVRDLGRNGTDGGGNITIIQHRKISTKFEYRNPKQIQMTEIQNDKAKF